MRKIIYFCEFCERQIPDYSTKGFKNKLELTFRIINFFISHSYDEKEILDVCSDCKKAFRVFIIDRKKFGKKLGRPRKK